MTHLTKKPAFALSAISALLLSMPSFVFADQTTSYTYNALGLIETIDGRRTDVSDVTTFTYDASANLTQVTNALGHSSQITSHDASGRPLTLVDANGATTTLTYDVRGRLLSQDTAGNLTQYSYDATGNVETITLANGEIISYHYDSAHRPIGYSDALGNKITVTLDAAGNQLTENITDSSLTLTRSHQYVYDELSRLRSDIGADSQTATFDYDVNNNLTDQVDPNANPTNFAFDALDRLIDTTDAAAGHTTYSYDERDNLASVTDQNGNTTTYTYDSFDNLISQDSPDTGVTTYTYDDAANRLTQTDARGITTTYTYDAINRLTSVSYPDASQNITYTYDENGSGQNGIGRLTSQSDASGTSTYAYDLRGNVLSMTTTLAGNSFTTSYSYNNADQLTQISYPDGRTLDYQYDLAGRLTQVDTTDSEANTQSLLSNMSYQPFGPLKDQTYGNGLTMTQASDLDYRQTSLTTANILERDYGFDANSNITSIADNLTTTNQSFDYDNLNRLDNANDSDANYGDIDYQYDAVHNRTAKNTIVNSLTGNESYQYQTDSNILETKTAGIITNYQYDANGNMTDNGRYQFSYGDNNRLQRVEQNSQVIATYFYNAQGQRSQKTTTEDTTYYLYGLQGELLAEAGSTGQLTTSYLFANGQLLAMTEDVVTTLPTALNEHYINHKWQTVEHYDVGVLPVIIAGVPTFEGKQPGVVRIRNITSTNVDIAFKEWNYLDGKHKTEQASLLTLAPGRYLQADGSIWEVGRFDISGTQAWHSQTFSQAFPVAPKVFLTSQTANGGDVITVRAKEVGTESFEAALFEQESKNDSGHKSETIGYLAIYQASEQGAITLPGLMADYKVTSTELKHKFIEIDGHNLKLQEEKSDDDETRHTFEDVASLAIEGHIFAQDNSTNGKNTVAMRRDVETLDTQALTEVSESTLFYVHNDHLGTPQTITDAAQSIVWQATYTPFGEATILTQVVENNVRFPGQYYDAETELHYNYYRYYDPTLGRYIASDPIGLAGGINTFGYVGGNPLTRIDLYGLDTIFIGGNVRIPTTIINAVLGTNIEGSGGSVGFAISFPGFYGGEFDIGAYLTGEVGGGDIGTGKAGFEFGYAKCSVQDMSGEGVSMGFNDGIGGLTLGLDNNNSPESIAIEIGLGVNLHSTGTLTTTISVRHGIKY